MICLTGRHRLPPKEEITYVQIHISMCLWNAPLWKSLPLETRNHLCSTIAARTNTIPEIQHALEAQEGMSP